MFGGKEMSDKELLKTVNRRLARGGGASLTASVQSGTVTIAGRLQYEAQRRPILKILNGIAGIRRVIDQLQVATRRPS